jgi:hypothetical protein
VSPAWSNRPHFPPKDRPSEDKTPLESRIKTPGRA